MVSKKRPKRSANRDGFGGRFIYTAGGIVADTLTITMKPPCATESRVHLTRSEFEREFVACDRPVVLRGAASGWPALTKWTPDYLKSKLNGVVAKMSVAGDGSHDLDPATGRVWQTEPMDVGEYLDGVFNDDPRFSKFYMQQKRRPLELLDGDVALPPYFDASALMATNLWVGPRGSFSSLHYDSSQNFLAQVRGKKHVLLFAPEDTNNLYARSWTTSAAHTSEVGDATRADLERFPGVRSAVGFEAELGPGDMLFIPCAWWHQVRTLEASISVNFWWRPRIRQVLMPSYLRIVASEMFRHTVGRFTGRASP